MPTASPPLSAAPYSGGYLSKLFGFGSGTGLSANHRPTGSMDEAHEYHPGLTALFLTCCKHIEQSQLAT